MITRFLDWLDHRTGHRALAHDALFEPILSGARFRYVTGSMLVFAFVTQTVTGLFLWMAYSPSSQTAYESVYYIQHEMTGGWILRGIHHFMAQAMVVVMALHLLQVVWDGAYRRPREFNHWLGLVLMQIVLGLGLTGYLLPWDQKGFWATNVATNLATLVPVVGKDLQQLAVGGNAYGHHTLTRFFAMHAGVLPVLLIVFLIAHVALFRRHGLTAHVTAGRPDEYFWPRQVLFDSIACLVLLVIVFLCVIHFDVGGLFSGNLPLAHRGAELGAPADPAEQYSAARPEWYYLFLFQLLKYFPGASEIIGALVIPGVVMTIFFLMPFIGYFQIGHRFNQAFTVLVLLAAVGLTGIALSEDYFLPLARRLNWLGENGEAQHPRWLFAATRVDEKGERTTEDTFSKRITASREFLEARETAEHDAQRVVDLIHRRVAAADGTVSDVQMVPREGAVHLLRNDPLTYGPRLFAQHCASCHIYVDLEKKSPWTFVGVLQNPAIDANGKVQRDENASVMYDESAPPIGAPNLFRFASRQWIKGLLNPAEISAVRYYPPPGAKTPEQLGSDDPTVHRRPIIAPYFGNTNHKNGRMATWVAQHAKLLKDDPAAADDAVDAIAAALSAQARLPAQREMDAKDTELIRKGLGLIEQNCARGCHRFGEAGQLGLAPDLTGYGSYEWMLGIISDPSHRRFYRMENDRMPSFASDLDHPERNNASLRELSLIVDWLRGEYYRADDKLPFASHDEDAAERAVSLARTVDGPYLPIVGAAPLPPETDRQLAERLFANNCASCHSFSPLATGQGDSATPTGSAREGHPSAPNLHSFASRDWLTGLLNPERIKSAHYFGNTEHAKGDMVQFVADNLSELEDEGKARLSAITVALSAEAALPSQAEADKAAEGDGTLEKGRRAFAESFDSSSCLDCHKFRDKGELGSAPDLTGWGSKDWLTRFISDPRHEAFYPESNDRMPSFGRSGPGPKKSLLTPAEIELVVRLIRGELP